MAIRTPTMAVRYPRPTPRPLADGPDASGFQWILRRAITPLLGLLLTLPMALLALTTLINHLLRSRTRVELMLTWLHHHLTRKTRIHSNGL